MPKRRVAGRPWSSVGEGLPGHHETHRFDHVLVVGELGFLIPENAVEIAPKPWRKLAMKRIALRVRAPNDPSDVLYFYRILMGGFKTHTPLCSDAINVGRADALTLQTKDARQRSLKPPGITRQKPASNQVVFYSVSPILGSIEENQLKNYPPQGKLPP